MKFAAWNELEQQALSGLPMLQRCLYMVLRWYMDHRTGRVGDTRGISYQSLAEELYVDPVQGRHDSGSPSVKAIRNALAQLEKAGLVRSCGSNEVLVFMLPKAVVSARSKKEGQVRGRVDGHPYQQPETANPCGFDGNQTKHEGQGSNAYDGHTSDVRVNNLSVETTSSSDQPVDNFNDRMMMPLTSGQMVDLVAWLERKRGKQSPVVATDQRLSAWRSLGVTGMELSEAHRLAVAEREHKRNDSPVNAGFLDSILRSRVLDRRSVSRESKRSGGEHWYASEAGVRAKAVKLGMAQQDSETFDQFRWRINDTLVQQEKAQRKVRKAL